MNTESISNFFSLRAQRLSSVNPLSAVMYQDSNPDLAEARDLYEKNTLLPKMFLEKNSIVLDYGCGTARLGKYLAPVIGEYIGIDPSQDFIDYAEKELAPYLNVKLICGATEKLNSLGAEPDRIIIGGVTQYLEDQDLADMLKTVSLFFENSKKAVILYLRTSVSCRDKFELNQVWSEELQSYYSAIYRSAEEMKYFLEKNISNCSIIESGPAYPKELGNRIETMQYYWVIKNA